MPKKGRKQAAKEDSVATESNHKEDIDNDEEHEAPETTEEPPKRGSKRGSTATKEDKEPASKKKKGKIVEENGVSRGSSRPKRATAAKAATEVKTLMKVKKRKPLGPRKEPSQFEVDQILGTRKRKGKTEYKIRWKGYSASSDTWEPARNLTNCTELLDAWKAENEKEKAE